MFTAQSNFRLTSQRTVSAAMLPAGLAPVFVVVIQWLGSIIQLDKKSGPPMFPGMILGVSGLSQ